MRKGVAPALVLAIAAVLIIGFEFFAARNLMYKNEVLKRIGMEQEFIQALNRIEFFKRFLKTLVKLSYCEGKDLDSFKYNLAEYGKMYGLTINVMSANFRDGTIEVSLEVVAKGNFFTIKDLIDQRMSVKCD